MKILSMTASFGKLESRRLELAPGLNVICAPNEWGKSTWCAFLLAMLYGVDTRQRAKQGTIPDKERYRPWSGRPMEGSMNILWRGRAITIQRRTAGRVPMGEFSAFETDTGLPVPELTANNCGQMLLGLERSVYQRCGFVRGADLPVTQDEALYQRLNQLVTMGDDGPEAARLEAKLRDLRNKCQYNKTGLIPQVKGELTRCREALEERKNLEEREAALKAQMQELDRKRGALERHERALAAREIRQKLERVEAARKKEQAAQREFQQAQARCGRLPSREKAEAQKRELDRLDRQMYALDMEAAMELRAQEDRLPEAPQGLDRDQAAGMIRRDLEILAQKRETLQARPQVGFWPGGALLLLALGLLWLPGWWKLMAVPILGVGLWVLLLAWGRKGAADSLRQWRQGMMDRYGSLDEGALSALVEAWDAHGRQSQERVKRLRELDARREALQALQDGLPDRETLEEVLAAWDHWAGTHREALRAKSQREAMEAMARGLEMPEEAETDLTLSPEEVRHALEEVRRRQEAMRAEKDRVVGQRMALEPRQTLEVRLEALQDRLETLNHWYAALGCGLEALDQAQRELRSRFAPKIAREAGRVLEAMTDGRYDRLKLEQDLSLSAATREESTLVSEAWRSDGTADQMYLALRLAVSRALAPEAPLVLDDALARFDDARMAACLRLLRKEDRQVILFSCQGREEIWLREQQDS